MFDEAISLLSIWASMNSWLTPSILFLFLNLMIGTIFITSSFNNSPKPQPHQQQPSQITRAPSVLQRLKSINIYSYYSKTHLPESDQFQPEKNPSRAEPATVQTVKFMHEPEPRQEAAELIKNRTQSKAWAPAIQEDFTDDEGPTFDEIYSRIKGISSNGHNRQNSDTLPMSGDIPVRLPAKMKKSASDESAFNHFEAEIAATGVVEEREITAAVMAAAGGGGGAEVDARADDFINRFKKQLELQRIESIVRYKDMITRGSAM